MKIRYIFLLIPLYIACHTQPSEQGLSLDLTKQLYGKESTFPLSEICDRISYIPLETHPEAILNGRNMEIKLSAQAIFINDNNSLYKFDSTGKFLGKLANHGRGPHEFLQIMSFDLNRKANELYLYDNILGKIEVFDTALQPVRTLKALPHDLHSILTDDDNHIVCSKIRNDYKARGKIQNCLVILDAFDGHEIFSRKSSIPSIEPKGKNNFLFSTVITRYNDRIYYKEHRSDTYYILQDTSRVDSIVYRIHAGTTYPDELDYNWERQEEISNYPRLGGAIETFHHIFIYFFPKNEDARLACYDKEKQKLIVFPKNEFPFNDIDHGVSPKCFRKLNDTTLLEIIPATKFLNLYGNNNKLHISEEDNPILMLIHLKK